MTAADVLAEHHVELLVASAVDLDVAVVAGVRSIAAASELPDDLADWRRRDGIAPGLLFTVTGPNGATVHQYRPDRPVVLSTGRELKYLFPAGELPALNVHPATGERLDGTGPVVIVEGTRQHLAAVSYVPEGVAVVGIAGCWSWSRDQAPHPDLGLVSWEGRDVVVCFDADVAAKFGVWTAADRLAGVLGSYGAASVRFVKLPAGGTAGLDDYLARAPEARRGDVLRRLIDGAGKLPRRPAKDSGGASPTEGMTYAELLDYEARAAELGDRFADDDDPAAAYFDANGLRVVDVVAAVREGRHFALGLDGAVWTYRDGIYHDDDHALVNATRELLGNRWRGMHHRNALDVLAAELADEGRRLPEVPIRDLVAVPNGMLCPLTGELRPHAPDHLAYAALAVPWEPSATCPTFDAWLVDRCGTQAPDVLEALGLLLTPDAGQRRVVFLIGPTRSGKGTLLRLIECIVGDEHRSAVTLHDLAASRFAAANLVGRILNSAGDLSDRHVDDLSLFKMLTGADSVPAERKFRDAFVFRNSALFVFSANTPPTVPETSRAYAARIVPVLFPHSFEGAEDASVERAMLAELPGILVRLVEAVQRWHARGGYAPVNPVVADLFARQSDPVAAFAAQVLEPCAGAFTASTDLHDTFRRWAEANGRAGLGRNKLLARVDNVLGPRGRQHSDGTGPTGWHDWRILPEAEWADDDATYTEAAPHVAPPERAEPADEPDSARSAASPLLTAHEGSEVSEGEEVSNSIPCEPGIGPERAERAEPDPDEWGEELFA